jgi:ketosteroid isomerase-like protein
MSSTGPKDLVEQTILRIEEEVFAAIQKKDADSFSRFLADDFIYRTPDGSDLKKDEFLRNISSTPVQIVSVRGEHQKVRVFGDVAVLTGVQRAKWRQGDETEGVSSVAFTDVFALREGSWQMVLAYGVELQS